MWGLGFGIEDFASLGEWALCVWACVVCLSMFGTRRRPDCDDGSPLPQVLEKENASLRREAEGLRDAAEYDRRHGRSAQLDRELDEAAEEAARLRRELNAVSLLADDRAKRIIPKAFTVLCCADD